MNVSLTPDLQRLIREKVESGMYGNASEVVREALRVYFTREKVREYYDREIQKGLDDYEAGRYFEATPEFFEELKKEMREKVEGKLKKAG